MQRVLRDPQHEQPTDEALRDRRVSIIQKHFPPSVADVYAIPRLGEDQRMEWWTRQQGLVRPFSGLSDEEKQALLQAYERHQEQLKGLLGALESRGMTEQFEQVKTLQRPVEPQNLYSVEGRLLVVRWLQDPEPPPPPPPPPAPVVTAVAPPPRRSIWPWLLALLLLLLLLLAAWWFFFRPRPVAPVVPPVAVEMAEESDQEWPSELAFVLDTSEFMAQSPGRFEPIRAGIADREIRKIVGQLPEHTAVRLLHASGGACTDPMVQHGPYTEQERHAVLEKLDGLPSRGPASLAAGLQAAAATLDGRKREALIMAFLGSDDTCGQDICAVARSIVEGQPKLRISLVDLSGTASIGHCISDIPGGAFYFWGNVAPGDAVDLSTQVRDALGQ